MPRPWLPSAVTATQRPSGEIAASKAPWRRRSMFSMVSGTGAWAMTARAWDRAVVGAPKPNAQAHGNDTRAARIEIMAFLLPVRLFQRNGSTEPEPAFGARL